jgi:sulfate adenylyltransferase
LNPLLVAEARAQELKQTSLDLPSVTLSQRQLCDLELLMCGAFTPLTGFMGEKAYDHVLEHGRPTWATASPRATGWPCGTTRVSCSRS